MIYHLLNVPGVKKDLEECFTALQDEGGVKGLEAEASQYEKPYIKRLIEMCKDIVDEFEDETED